MVDQNANSAPQSPNDPHASNKPANKDPLAQPNVVQAGETMLILSLGLILMVCCSVAVHLFLKRRKRRRKPREKRQKSMDKKIDDSLDPKITPPPALVLHEELHSQVHFIAELVGTPICEIGPSEPRHEMEDLEVQEHHLHEDLPGYEESEMGSYYETTGGDEEMAMTWYNDLQEKVVPDSRELAMYWSRGL